MNKLLNDINISKKVQVEVKTVTKQNISIILLTTTLKLGQIVLEGLKTTPQERLYRTLVSMHKQTMTTGKNT